MQDEKNLVKRAQDGEAEAFGQLYDQYLPKIYRFVLIKVTHREEAEDLTHQAFLQAWQNIEKYVAQGFPFSSWLYKIARNIVIDHYRKTSKKTISLENVDIENEWLLSEDQTIEKDIDISTEHTRVMAKIKNLTSDQQDVIIMRFVDGLSLREVAQAMEKSEGAVKLLQHRAMNNLKKSLKKNERTDTKN